MIPALGLLPQASQRINVLPCPVHNLSQLRSRRTSAPSWSACCANPPVPKPVSVALPSSSPPRPVSAMSPWPPASAVRPTRSAAGAHAGPSPNRTWPSWTTTRPACTRASPVTFTAEQIVQIINLACTHPAAAGRPVDAWTPRELAAEAEKRQLVPSISPRTVGRFLKASRSQTTS